jgi:hypothetical protein
VQPGDLDVAIMVSGYPGCGKTTYALARVRELMAQGPCYVIAHDPRRDLTRKEPALTQRHRSEAECDAAFASSTTAPGIHTLDVGDAMRVLVYARQVAARAAPAGVPTYLYLDECAALRQMSPSYIDPDVQEYYLGRRHELLGYIFVTQRLQLIHPTLLENASELVIFRTRMAKQLKRYDDLGLEDLHPGILEQIRTLPDHHHLVVTPNG